MHDEVFRLLEKKMNTVITDIESVAMDQGPMSDLNRFNHLLGHRQGLLDAIEILKETEKKLYADDDSE